MILLIAKTPPQRCERLKTTKPRDTINIECVLVKYFDSLYYIEFKYFSKLARCSYGLMTTHREEFGLAGSGLTGRLRSKVLSLLATRLVTDFGLFVQEVNQGHADGIEHRGAADFF
jgi:hypothetical protein